MIYKQYTEAELSDINIDKRLKNKAILRYFENAASKHSDFVKNGVNNIIDTGISWVLLEWKMQVLERPKYGDVFEIHTWVRNSSKLYSYRDFELYVNGQKRVNGSSKWLLVDINTLRPKKITEELVCGYAPEQDKNVFGMPEFEKFTELSAYAQKMPYPIRKSDIDINGHVHNLNYLDMAYEILPYEKEFDYVGICYKKGIKYGDEVNILCTETDGNAYFRICGADNSTNALIELKA